MTIRLTDQESAYLLELLEAAQAKVLHELHHTDTRDFKELLKERADIIEGLRVKLKDEQPNSANHQSD